MPRFKITLAFSGAGIGASETYLSPDSSITSITPIVQRLINVRRAMMFRVTNWQGVRIATYGVRRRSIFLPPGTHRPFVEQQPLVVPGTGDRISADKDNRPDQARACLQVRMRYDNDRNVTRYLCFVPDGIMYDEALGVDMSDFASFAAQYQAWIDCLINDRWSIRALDKAIPNQPANIRDWVQQAAAPTNLGIVLPSAPPLGIQQRDIVRVSGVRRRGTDKVSYNGKYIVNNVNTTQVPDSVIYYLRGTETGDPLSVKLPGTVTAIKYTEFPILQVSAVRPGVHKRGKALGVPVGRRVNRVSLDF